MQNLLTIIAYFDNSIPLPAMNGVFDARTKNSLTAFQTQYGLEPTGVLNRQSANMLLSVYRDTRAMATENGKSVSRLIYPGRAILRGRTGADVEDLQSLINRAAAQNAFIPQVAEDGIFGEATENAVKAVQAHEGLDVNGIVGPLTWQALLRLSGLSPVVTKWKKHAGIQACVLLFCPNYYSLPIKMYSRIRMRMPQRVRAALTMNSAKIQESNSAVP